MLRLSAQADSVSLHDGELTLPLPPQAGETQIRDRAQAWLQREASAVFADVVAGCAKHLSIPPPAWRLSMSATERVRVDGTCLRLSWRLIERPLADIECCVSRALAELLPRPDLWCEQVHAA